MKRGRIDYNNRIKFLDRVRQWLDTHEVEKHVTYLAREMGVSKSTVSLWFKPFNTNKPSVNMQNIKRLERLTGLKYEPATKWEQSEYKKWGL